MTPPPFSLGVLGSAVAASGGGSLALTWQQAATSTSNATTYTFNSVAIGTAAADRIVVVAAATRKAPPSPTSATITIGGVSATIDVTETAADNGNCFVIGHALVPSGTTATVAVTFSAQGLRCGIGVWTITGADVTATGSSDNGVNSASAALTVAPGGAAVALAGAFNLSTEEPNNFTWAVSTERYESVIESGFGIGYADLDTSGTVSVTGPGGSTAGMTLVAASYAPA